MNVLNITTKTDFFFKTTLSTSAHKKENLVLLGCSVILGQKEGGGPCHQALSYTPPPPDLTIYCIFLIYVIILWIYTLPHPPLENHCMISWLWVFTPSMMRSDNLSSIRTYIFCVAAFFFITDIGKEKTELKYLKIQKRCTHTMKTR